MLSLLHIVVAVTCVVIDSSVISSSLFISILRSAGHLSQFTKLKIIFQKDFRAFVFLDELFVFLDEMQKQHSLQGV